MPHELFSLLPSRMYVLLYVTALLEAVTPGVEGSLGYNFRVTDYACTTTMKRQAQLHSSSQIKLMD